MLILCENVKAEFLSIRNYFWVAVQPLLFTNGIFHLGSISGTDMHALHYPVCVGVVTRAHTHMTEGDIYHIAGKSENFSG